MKKVIFPALLMSLLSIGLKAQQGMKSSRIRPVSEIVNECIFFSGDTLQGFDIAACVKEALLQFPHINELRAHVFKKEIEFIRNKYHRRSFYSEQLNQAADKINPIPVLTSACNNVDFENGNFTGWTGYVGYNSNSNGALTTTATGINTLGLNSPEPSCSYHTLVSTGADPYSGLNMVSPGGGIYSARLGGEDINEYHGNSQGGTYACTAGSGNGILTAYSGGEILQQTFLVTRANALFSYSYAVVLNDGGHTNGQQPYFRLEVLDNSGNPIPCLQYYQQVNSGVPPAGYMTSSKTNWSDLTTVYYSPWTQNSLNLTSYIGQNVTIRFTAAGCIAGGHFGYAYVDCSCGPVQVIAPSGMPCAGSNGTLTAPPSVGGAYQWSGPGVVSGANSQVVTVNASGTYSVTVTGAGGCVYTIDTTITFIPNPTVTVNSGTVCMGTSVSLNASGATTYSWSPGTGLSSTAGASVSANPASTTVYTVTGTTNNCSGTATATVTVNPLPTVTVNSGTICVGNSVSLNASGASTYTWSPGTGLSSTTGASVTANPSVTTTYTITGTSVSGCTNTATGIVTVNPLPTVTVNSGTICIGNPVSLNANGASTYTWSPGTGLSSTTGASVTANPSVTTTYTVTGTSASGCTNTVTTIVTVNPSPTVSVNSGTICVGNTVSLNASGASTYAWSPATGLSSTTGASVTANPSVTTTYTVTGTSVNGCTNTATSIVTVNPTPTISVTSATICPGGTATLTASGASTYTWNTGATGPSISGSPSATTGYTVTGTSTAGCVSTATASITVVSSLVVSVNSATICAGNSATLTASGAATYSWSPGTGLSSTSGASVTASPSSTTVYTITGTAGTCSAVTTATVTVNPGGSISVNTGTICVGNSVSLNATGTSTYTWSPGTGLSSTNGASVTANPNTTTSYTVTGTDVNGCVYTTTTSVNVNPLPTITVNTATVCNGSSATLTAGGASTYTWSPAATLSSSTGASVTANPSATTQYTVTATNANGCVNTATTSVTVVANPTINVNSPTICAGSTATLTASGGSSYTWSPTGTLSSSTGATVTANPSSTTAYTINATVGTCTTTGTATVTVVNNPSITVNNPSICSGSTATLTASGGSSYTWSPAGTLSSSTGATVTANPSSTTVYTINATVGTCSATATATVTVNTLPTITVPPGFICNGGSATLTASGASTYTWSPAASLSSSMGSSVTASPTVTTQYTITGTDINGCMSSASTTVNVVTNPTVSVNSASICSGQQTATLVATGASSFNWAPNSGLNNTSGSNVIANPSATTVYTITGTVGSCTATGTATVTVNPLPNITAGSNSPVCVNGTLNLNAAGGSSYAWSGPSSFVSTQQNPTISGVSSSAAGTYSVAGVDVNGCVNSATVNVIVNPLPNVTATGATVCVNSTINLSSGPGGVTYSWSGPGNYSSNQQNPSIPGASAAMAGIYFVTVTDQNGCVNASGAQIVVNTLPMVSAASLTVCPNSSVVLTASGANTYTWLPSSGLSNNTGASVNATATSTTHYTVTGTDANGCQNAAPVTVYVNPAPQVNISPLTTSGCVPLCVNFSNTSYSNGNCSWTFGDGTTNNTSCAPQHCFTKAGSYSVSLSLTDSNGCKNSSVAQVIVYPQPHAAFYANPQPATILDPTITFTDISSGAVVTAWNWTFGNSAHSSSIIQNPSFTYSDPGSYPVHLTVTSNHGCKDSTTVLVEVDPEYAIYIPNAFSPNSDGVNDIFYAKGEGISEFKLYIFDRWGEQVFFSDDLYKGWDGTFQAKGNDIVQQDVYVWKIELKNIKGEHRQLSGTVSLIK